jgi:hypothetical protein
LNQRSHRVNAQEFGGFWLGSIGRNRCGGSGCIFEAAVSAVELLALGIFGGFRFQV